MVQNILLYSTYIYLFLLIGLCKSEVDNADFDLHESQIPPPHQQPKISPEEIKDELKRLFTEVDANKDSLLSIEETTNWIESVHKQVIKENVERQWYYYEPTLQLVHSWEGYKPEEKEVLQWGNYVNKTRENENDLNNYNESLDDLMKRAKRRWDTADKNNDSVLIKEEFADFAHPEESDRDEMKDVLVQEAFEDMDKNNDKSISLSEYMNHLSAMAVEEERDDATIQIQQDHFTTYLDNDKNGELNADEIKKWLAPSHHRHELEAKRIISENDKNADERLSEDEMIGNFNEFFSLIPPEFWSRYMSDESPYQHDEL